MLTILALMGEQEGKKAALAKPSPREMEIEAVKNEIKEEETKLLVLYKAHYRTLYIFLTLIGLMIIGNISFIKAMPVWSTICAVIGFVEMITMVLILENSLSKKSLIEEKIKKLAGLLPGPPPKSLYCPTCYQVFEKKDNYCRCCGRAEDAIACPRCQLDVDKKDLFCRRCACPMNQEQPSRR